MTPRADGATLAVTRVDGPVLTITLNRAEKRNAVDQALADELDRALALLESEPALRVGILTGGQDCFCSGTDLTLERSPVTPSGGEYGLIRRPRTKPLIAAVEGIALGGGLEMVMACDLVVASSAATFGLPEVARGLVASCGGLFRAHSRLSPNVAMELLLTGRRLPAQRAYELGLANVVTAKGDALAGARQLAGDIVRNSPTAVAHTYRAAARARDERDQGDRILSDRATADNLAEADAREGRVAFAEGRDPAWSPLVEGRAPSRARSANGLPFILDRTYGES